MTWPAASGIALLAVLAAGAACDRPAPGTPTTTPAADTAASSTADLQAVEAFVSGTGVGANEEAATEAAREALVAAVLGSPRWSDLVELQIHRPPEDPIAIRAEPDGRVRVQLGLSRARAAAVLSALELATPRIAGPPAWRDDLYAYLTAHVATHACDRRRALFSAACEAGHTIEVDAALAELASEVELSAPYPDGIPTDREGHALRPLQVSVLWRGSPLAEVPVRATSEPASLLRTATATSDPRGQVTFTADDAPLHRIEIAVDAAAMLGPLASAWPVATLQLQARPFDSRRWSAVMTEGDGDAELLGAMDARLREHGAASLTTVPAADARSVLGSDGDARARNIARLADTLRGKIDVLYVVTATSRFASRMGESRVWYEATGRIRAHDAWTGRVLCSVDATVTASGLGNERADRAARAKLGTALADRLAAEDALRLAAR